MHFKIFLTNKYINIINILDWKHVSAFITKINRSDFWLTEISKSLLDQKNEMTAEIVVPWFPFLSFASIAKASTPQVLFKIIFF